MKIKYVFITLVLVLSVTDGKKKKKSKSGSSEKVNLFDSKTLNCLVCKALVEEIEGAINKVDPAKKVETGTFRLNGDGSQSKKLVKLLCPLIAFVNFCPLQIPYARSQEHLSEVVDNVCKGFEDYAQAKKKSNGEPTIIRLMTHEGNMNPEMSQVDIVPDEDLNTRLKFYVSKSFKFSSEIPVHLLCFRNFYLPSRKG